jgi:hypothetical protein
MPVTAFFKRMISVRHWPSVSGSIIQDCGSESERKYLRSTTPWILETASMRSGRDFFNWFDFLVSRPTRQQLLPCLAHPTPESGGQNTGFFENIF